MTDEYQGEDVYAVARSEFNPDVDKPIGKAVSRGKACRMIKAYLSERDGGDYELSANDIIYSPSLKAWCIDD